MKVMDGSDAMIAVGLRRRWRAASAIGAANYLLIWALRIPPIIATLSASFIIQSIDISYGRGLQIKPPPGFADFTNRPARAAFRCWPIVTVLFTVVVGVVLHRTDLWPLGAAPSARTSAPPGSPASRSAASASSPTCCRARSAASTARCSPAISAAPRVDIGNEYLLASIAVVVIGGTSVAGGKANVPGLWGAALFLVLLLTMLNTFGVSAGVRPGGTGPVIIGVIIAAGGQKALR